MSYYDKTAHALADLLAKKEASSVEITKSCLERIDMVDPKVNAYITVDAEGALAQAAKADEARTAGEAVHPLAGVPIAVKDNICTKGLATTCASRMLEHFVPPYDAFVTRRIREAGMVILGKLNMDEFAMGSSTENSSFFQTKNPWNLDYVPGGSSGGSAACVAADMAPLALGSDTGGSIRQPAHYCGVVGMKPTYGRVSRYGLVAFASSLDQIGPLTKDVRDAALALNLICGHDPMDSSSAPLEVPDFTASLGQDVAGMRIALPRAFMGEGIQREVKEAVLAAAARFEAMGAVVEEVDLTMTDMALPAYYLISSAEASSNLARFDGIKYGHRAKSYDNLLDLYKQTREEGFGTEVKRRIMLGTYALSSGYYDAYYKKAQQVRTLIKGGFDEIFAAYDLILTPTGPTTAFKLGAKTADPVAMYLNDICTVPVNIAGLPAISMNCGFDDLGLPIGLQLVGKAFDEHSILKAADAYEKAGGLSLDKPRL
ncbi:Asp-tRNA(Asn)/Glu-tRNA(Gln) amidotransferase subunit GatA [Anaerotalea alkaliphila]|uniref:Glutamyl-tRNA(Gln) amidotransferase subunit A n=1 Tax=Anaerotalea alkaliphila TaxID=2662126 RepID=A0A7X5HVT5_9FIRM|nr:Asp-tRNA(Asn)/Glu-tRNA(Gln) amidotransferase subunit GatA [Anaerotalea alkaliphila]NDL67582.1 Asp-tRNA(Asn)/Glu-tRNA(Gln) amidotransferase subunit GatA [Anaerotalea alkaliphila]